ncbi:MAG TPA: DUF308 domain-containing protein [Puia sp.]|nr:DUF308 domain-containing protein [Puia sp.]
MSIISDVRTVVRYWWLFLLLGCLLIFFGILVFNSPSAAYAQLSIYFVIAFVINGLFEVGFALGNRLSVRGWGWHLAGGLFDLLAAGVLYFTPVVAATSLPFFAGFWLLFRSIAIIGRCFDLPVVPLERAAMLTVGAAGLAFSFLVLYYPVTGSYMLIFWTGCALIAIGLFYVFLGMHLKRWSNTR